VFACFAIRRPDIAQGAARLADDMLAISAGKKGVLTTKLAERSGE
jgi:hypothetical protein